MEDTKVTRKRTRAEAGLEEQHNPESKRRQPRDEIPQLIGVLEERIRPAQSQRVKKEPQQKLRRRSMTLLEQQLVVFLRHGSLSNDSRVCRTFREIFEKTGIKISTQEMILKRWRDRGFKVERQYSNCRSKPILTPEQQLYVVHPDTLRAQSHLSLEERAQLIRERFDLPRLCGQTLANYYHKLGVSYRKPTFHYVAKKDKEEALRQHQLDVSMRLVKTMLRLDCELVYIDETTFHLWQTASRFWLGKDMRLPLSDQRGSSMTLIGALSEQRGLICYEIVHGSNNAQTFEHFVITLKAKTQFRKTFVVLDNLSVHKSKRVSKHFNFGFEQLFLPPYSCELNPIERLWNLVKNQWKRQQHHFACSYHEGKARMSSQAEARLRDILDALNPDTTKSLARSHLPSLLRSLRGQLV